MGAHLKQFLADFRLSSTFSLMLVVVLLGHSVEASDVYTWRDGQGRVHFADRPALSFPARNLTQQPAFGYVDEPNNASPERASTAKSREIALPESASPETALPENDAVAASQRPAPTDTTSSLPKNSGQLRMEVSSPSTDPESCKIYEKKLSALRQFQRLRVKNAQGESVFLSQLEKQALIDETVTQIARFCS